MDRPLGQTVLPELPGTVKPKGGDSGLWRRWRALSLPVGAAPSSRCLKQLTSRDRCGGLRGGADLAWNDAMVCDRPSSVRREGPL